MSSEESDNENNSSSNNNSSINNNKSEQKIKKKEKNKQKNINSENEEENSSEKEEENSSESNKNINKSNSLLEYNINDPNNIFSNKTFSSLNICPELLSILSKLGYEHPTKIQSESLPYSLKFQDIIGLAETGSGKTLAFVIPVLQSLLNSPQSHFYCLVLAPTRELCIQINEVFENVGSEIGLKTTVLVGGLDLTSQAISLSKKPHIIIGTPGRVADHLANTKGFNLKNCKFLIFDEADRLLDMDFEKQINQILDVINKDRNTFLFSATMTSKVHKLQKASLKNPVKIEINTKYTTVNTLIQNYIFIPEKYKETYLCYILNENVGKTIIVFVEKVLDTMLITFLLRYLGFSAISINGKMTQSNRISALKKFKLNERNILIATDVASRGLDIPNVDLIINYDLPQQAKDYIHRVGRTARAGKSGRAISFVTQYDVEGFQSIEHLIGKKMEEYKTNEKKVLSLYEKVLEAKNKANGELKDLTKKLKTKDKFDTKADDDNDEGEYEEFLKHKKNRENNFKNRSFVKRRKK